MQVVHGALASQTSAERLQNTNELLERRGGGAGARATVRKVRFMTEKITGNAQDATHDKR